MKEATKISIIVPVYKVEDYLKKCLDSLIAQTHRDLQIILVDDGSPDSCGEICDEYAAKDKRIVVVHKENGGVSSARNAGLALADGEWIGWVDPDDWTEPDMYAYLLEGAKKHGADIVVCGRQEEYSARCVPRGCQDERCLSTETALQLLLENDTIQSFLWDKLWKRSLFDGVEFPEGRTFEDMTVMHRLFERAGKVCCLPAVKYHYLQREGSIVSNLALKNKVNFYLAAQKRRSDLQERWPQFRQLLEVQCMTSIISLWCSYLRNSKEERKKYLPQIQEISKFAKQHYKTALKYANTGAAGRFVLRLTPHPYIWAFALAWLCGQLFEQKYGVSL